MWPHLVHYKLNFIKTMEIWVYSNFFTKDAAMDSMAALVGSVHVQKSSALNRSSISPSSNLMLRCKLRMSSYLLCMLLSRHVHRRLRQWRWRQCPFVFPMQLCLSIVFAAGSGQLPSPLASGTALSPQAKASSSNVATSCGIHVW